MATDARGHTVPAAADHPTRQALLTAMLSVKDPIPVADSTARATLISTLAALSPAIVPSTSNPVFVFRADAATGANVEYTTDGSTWRAIYANDTGSVTAGIVAGSGWSLAAASGYEGLSYRIKSGWVFVYGVVSKASWSASDTIATLPAAAWPDRLVNNQTHRVSAAGVIQINASGTTNTVVDLIYPIA